MCRERADPITSIFPTLKSLPGGDTDSSFSNRADVAGHFYGPYHNNSSAGPQEK